MRPIMFLPILFASLLLGAAFFHICYAPQRAEIARIESEIREERESLMRVQNFMNASDAHAHEEALAARGVAAEKRLPKSMGQGSFLELLEREAQHEQLTLAAVVPGETAKEGGALRLPLEVEIDGDYFHLLAFLKELEKSERFVRMENAEIHSDDGRLHVKIRLSIFAEEA